MSLAPGTRLGPYEILALIGAGGMGQVYKARDTRVERTVAIKVSQRGFNERFEREAHAIAALNHPNICQLYDVGPDYLVMEFVDGGPLRGPLSLDKTLEYATQILDALDAAHQKGITHRDLKPANILATKHGIKLLDFGLAKLQSSTLKEGDATLTVEGQIVGTLQYMSPEQLRGKEADARSDLFSFGCVLYEMLTGKRPFVGENMASVVAAILEREPAMPKMALPLERILKRCLAKDPDQRFQTARDLRAALIWALEQPQEQPPAAEVPRRSSWFRLVWAGAFALAVAGIALLGWRELPNSPRASWAGVLLGGPEIAVAPRISPDGHTLAFLAMERGVTQVAVMKPDTGDWTILTHKRNAGSAVELNWSADGNKIYFDREADIPLGVFSVPALGGEEQPILEDGEGPEPLPDGTLLVVRLSPGRELQVYRYWPESGRLEGFPVKVMSPFAKARVFPDGRHAVVLGDRLGPGQLGVPHVYILDLASKQIRQLPTGAADDSSALALAVSRDGKYVLISRAAEDRTEIVSLPASGRGPPRVLFGSSAVVQYLDSSPDGAIYMDEWEEPVHILRSSATGGPVTLVSTFQSQAVPRKKTTFFLSDGRAIVPAYRAGRERLMLVEKGKDPVPLVNTTEETSSPATAAGPGQVAFAIGEEPHRTLAIASLANGRVTRRIAFDGGEPRSLAASPDGNTLYCAAAGTIWSIAVADGAARKLHPGEFVAVMPGGQSLLVEMVESGRTRLLEVQLSGSGEKEIPLNGPFHLANAAITSSGIRNGKLAAPLASLDSWFYQPGVVDLATGRMTRIPVDFQGDFHFEGWTADGQLVAWAHELRSTIWKMIQPAGR
jgi:tRNA A-37 threonylcarbamoyl transferase component Bud32